MDEHNENWHQRQLIQWARQFAWGQYLFHIPNETTGGRGWIVRNNQMGCKKGVPDLMLPIPMHGYHGMFIEMKKPGGRLSYPQRKWLNVLNMLGYFAICCEGWEAASDALQRYMEEEDTGQQTDGI